MTWQDDGIEIVRVLISDLDDTPKYSDPRIERVLVIAANQVIQEVSLPVSYTVNILGASISPEPDAAFINLFATKAAYLIIEGEIRQYSLYSVRIIDGPSSIDMTGVVANLRNTLNSIRGRYETLKATTNLESNGRAVLTPYTNQNINPEQRF